MHVGEALDGDRSVELDHEVEVRLELFPRPGLLPHLPLVATQVGDDERLAAGEVE